MNHEGRNKPDEAILATVRSALSRHKRGDGTYNISAIGRETGLDRTTAARYVHRAAEEGEPEVSFPREIFSEHEPIADILERKKKGFERKAQASQAREWFPIKVKETLPYGILTIGDPHLDDDGCNVPLLERHLAVARKPGVYAINMGDTTNNWVGRLERLYAQQETGKNTGKRLVEWFMWDSGAKWLCWLLGNHDGWNDGVDFHMRLSQKKIPVIDWRAQFRVVHSSGTEARIDASHGRKGSSIWNNLHATLRAAKLGEVADAYLTGHTHNFGIEDLEIAERRFSTWLLQLRGYKWDDSYALYNGFAEHQRGASVLMIVDPRSDARRVIPQVFEDVEAGADYLAWMRSR